MAQEIERKFLVKKDAWPKSGGGKRYRQGYLSIVKERTVRVRTVNGQGFITVKGVNIGAMRSEYEYEIPYADASEMLERLCQRPLIEKTRYRIPYEGLIWEVDEFEGENRGLVVAEVEFQNQEQLAAIPEWVDQEVTQDVRYFNDNLVSHPFAKW